MQLFIQVKMTATTYPQFGHDTEGLEVTKAFADRVRGKTAIVTGVNRNGIGYTIAEAIVSITNVHWLTLLSTKRFPGLAITCSSHNCCPQPRQGPGKH